METRERIQKLHDWYCAQVMRVRLTPEIERLWLEWITAGYCGRDMHSVLIYLRKQINLGKRNEGSLKLSNLFERAEDGSFRKFDEDLGLSRARGNLNIDKRLAPAPDDGGSGRAATRVSSQREETHPAPQPPNPESPAAQAAFDEFKNLKGKL